MITPNQYLRARISASLTTDSMNEDTSFEADPRTEMDSHANMVVLGKHCFVFDGVKNRTCEVEPFDPTIGTAKKITIVDAALAYDCPYSLKTYVLLIRNALHVKSISHNLVPPFILREAGIDVNEVPKIHRIEPSIDDHSIYFPEEKLRIPLQLWGIFSFFHSRVPTLDEVYHSEKIFLTPDSNDWNPYSDHFALNEESMLDSDGNIQDRRYRKKHIVDMGDAVNNPSIMKRYYDDSVDTFNVSSIQAKQLGCQRHTCDYEPYSHSSHDLHSFQAAIESQTDFSKFCSSVGAMSISQDECDLFEPVTFQIEDFDHKVVGGIQAGKPTGVSSEFLSKIWHISPELAEKTLQQTSQLYRHGQDNILSKRYPTNDRMLRYRRINSQFFTDTFFVTAKGKSTRGHSCAQLFVSDKGFVGIYPMSSKGQFPEALHQFCKEVGVPQTLVVDPAGEQTSKQVRRFCHQVGTTLRVLEESTQWANRAELYVGIFKDAIKQDLNRSNCPAKLWDYCAERRARIHNVTPRNLFQLNGHTPITATLGIQGDISNICQFDWYDWCYYREESDVQFPFQKRKLGRVLGPLKNEGNEMTQAVLTIEGTVVPRRSVTPLTTAEIHSESEKLKRAKFDEAILAIHGDSITVISNPVTPQPDPEFDELLPDEPEPIKLPEEDPVDKLGIALSEKPFSDVLINAEVLLGQGESLQHAKVKGRTRTLDGNTVGTYDKNPMLNSILYDVEFPDGAIQQYAANTIAQNLYSSVDEDGYSTSQVDTILDHAKDSTAVAKQDKYVVTKSGQHRLRKTTVGWKFLVRFKDGSTQWIKLKTLKETNPIQIADYAKANDLISEAALHWWVPYTLRKRDKIVAAVTARARKTTHKYGIEIPTSIQHAYELDEKNGDTMWRDAIDLEMPNLAVAFEILEPGTPIPVGWKKSSGHLVFDVKMDFTRKA